MNALCRIKIEGLFGTRLPQRPRRVQLASVKTAYKTGCSLIFSTSSPRVWDCVTIQNYVTKFGNSYYLYFLFTNLLFGQIIRRTFLPIA